MEARKSIIKVWVWLFSSGGRALPDSQIAYPLVSSHGEEREPFDISSHKDLNVIKSSFTLRTLFNINCLHQALVSKHSHIGNWGFNIRILGIAQTFSPQQ